MANSKAHPNALSIDALKWMLLDSPGLSVAQREALIAQTEQDDEPNARVRATRDHFAGPGTRGPTLAARKGAERNVRMNSKGTFMARHLQGGIFGVCDLNDGWELVKDHRNA